jgi:hypothetical protein
MAGIGRVAMPSLPESEMVPTFYALALPDIARHFTHCHTRIDTSFDMTRFLFFGTKLPVTGGNLCPETARSFFEGN